MRAGFAFLIALSLFLPIHVLHASELPHFTFEAPTPLRPVVARLERINPTVYRETMQMMGLVHSGSVIRVILAPEHSQWAQQAPSWASGYAYSQLGTIVLLPHRIVSYPYDSLANVLVHEVAHVLLARAAHGNLVPRWFDEGLAMVAAHAWDLEDRARLTWFMVVDNPPSLKTLNSLFQKDEGSAKQAYVLSHAFVRFLLKEFGSEFPRRLLGVIAQQVPFEEAFSQVALISLAQAETVFWTRQTVWTKWVPVATSSLALWLGIIALSLYAFKKQRQRAESLKRQWDEDD
jgi:hypothetical protein